MTTHALPTTFPLLDAACVPKVYGHIVVTPAKLAALEAGRRLRLAEVLDTLRDAVAAQSIRKVELTDLTGSLNRFAERAWEMQVSEAFSYGGLYESLPANVWDFACELRLSYARSAISLDKKLRKSTLSHPMLDAMRAVVDEVLPIALALEALKPVAVAGRAPRTGDAVSVENPDLVRKTCACCFRGIAVVAGTMAHHGYTRPGYGSQTASCMGISFAPLEVSDAGLRALIAVVAADLARVTAHHGAWEQWTSLTVVVGRTVREYTPAMPEWARRVRAEAASLASQITVLRGELDHLNTILVAWAPEAPMDPRRVPMFGPRAVTA